MTRKTLTPTLKQLLPKLGEYIVWNNTFVVKDDGESYGNVIGYNADGLSRATTEWGNRVVRSVEFDTAENTNTITVNLLKIGKKQDS